MVSGAFEGGVYIFGGELGTILVPGAKTSVSFWSRVQRKERRVALGTRTDKACHIFSIESAQPFSER